MILIFRKIKQSLFSEGKFRRYLLYALGEMVLVIIGILVALQIDNWNADRQKEASLQSYLGSIARNIRNDLAEVEAIHTRRERAIGLSFQALRFSWSNPPFSAEEIALASYALEEASESLHFNADMSGYEALKSSGVLDRMQGRDIENLLYDYYDTVNRITQDEDNHNEYLRQHLMQVRADWPRNLPRWEFENPTPLTPERILEIQPAFTNLLTNPSLISIYMRAENGGFLLLEYDRLDKLGRAFIRMIDNGLMEFDEKTLEILESIYDPEEGIGYPDVLTGGQLYWANYTIVEADSLVWGLIGNTLDSSPGNASLRLSWKQREDSLYVEYPGGASWAILFFTLSGASDTRTCQDFSMYEKIVLELKSTAGEETISVHMKDRDDPDDGTQTNIELQITDQWKQYEIDLADFKNADMSMLHIVFGFLFKTEPQSFSVRTIRFE